MRIICTKENYKKLMADFHIPEREAKIIVRDDGEVIVEHVAKPIEGKKLLRRFYGK